ncbi:hypothetical protein [Nonomuraea guangzhouensis]|uniref:Uncharacterized protein n=1 Tax=Nonomuraea guangzhouensis TaxID=1291555 RepID=A0ABW4G853_9ACTN|nr:hypothetical protein [Nonomuraea guangzhouensis]
MVELGHEFTVGGASGDEVVVAFFELEAQFYGLLLQMSDLLVEGVDVGGRAEPGLAPDMLAEQLGQAFLKLLDADVESDGAFVGGK